MSICLKISVRGAGAGCSRAVAGHSSSLSSNGNMAGGERRQQEIHLPGAGVVGETIIPQCHHGHLRDAVWEQECSLMGRLLESTCCGSLELAGSSTGWAPFPSPNTGDTRQLRHQRWVVSVAFLSEREEQAGGSQPAELWGKIHHGAFCLEVPMRKSVVLCVLILDG